MDHIHGCHALQAAEQSHDDQHDAAQPARRIRGQPGNLGNNGGGGQGDGGQSDGIGDDNDQNHQYPRPLVKAVGKGIGNGAGVLHHGHCPVKPEDQQEEQQASNGGAEKIPCGADASCKGRSHSAGDGRTAEQPREDQRHGKHKPQLLGGDQKPLKLRIPAAAQEGDQKGQEKVGDNDKGGDIHV